MRIKSLKVEDFFILKNFKIDFNNNFSVIIGENGSGKSTVLELIADIFGHLHKFFILNDKTAEFVENYEIVYDFEKDDESYTIEIHSRQYVDNRSCTFVPQILVNGEELSIAQIERQYGGMETFLPSKTILGYAGISDHLKLLSQHFEEKYKNEIIKADNQYSLSPLNLPKNRPFIYIRPEHLSMLIVSLFISDDIQDVDFLTE
ncbi:MAG: AAA family ATPase, partial [Bacilli bacterium]|nr:AAA family ATPase [Bacilli bacterium]